MKRFLTLLISLVAFGQTAQAAAIYTSPMILSVSYTAAITYSYHYIQFSNSTFVIPNNSRLEYDVYLPIDSADFNGAVDMGGGSLTDLRDYQAPSTLLYIRDQNYLRAHGFEDLSNFAKGRWYHRIMDMGSAGGLSCTGMALVTDTGNNAVNGSPANAAGFYNGYFDNIKFTNAYGVTTLDLYSNLLTLPQGGTSANGLWAQGGAGGVVTATARVSISTGLQFSVTPTANTADGLAPITVTVQLVGPGGPIPYTQVRLASSRLQDTLSPLTGTTDAFGNLTAVVKSTLAGTSTLSALAGPYSGSSSVLFTAGAATAYSFKPYTSLNVVATGPAQMGIVARDAFGNDTVTARSAWIHSVDANLQVSSDGVVFVAATTGVTLTPSTNSLSVWVKSVGGTYPRAANLLATDTVAASALAQGSRVLSINNLAANSLQILLPANGIAGVALNLTLTALDASSNPAFSNASVALSSSSPTGLFSVDQGNTWTSTQTVNLVNGQDILLYKDTKAGVSTANTTCVLSNPSASATIISGVPALISGGANPNALNISAPNNTSNLFALVSDVYGNPVSGTTVTFVVAPPTTSSVGSSTVVTDAFGMATDVLTFNSATADPGVYVRASVAGVKPTIVSLSLSSSNPTKLNLSPAPSTTGVNISTLMTLLAQDASSISGYSNHTVRLTSNSANLSFSGDNGGSWATTLDVSMTAGRRDFLYRSNQPTTLAGVTVTATDQTAPLLNPIQALVEIPRALLNVAVIQQPYANVSAGENGIPLTITVQNLGGTDAWLNPSSCSPTFGTDNANYTATFWAGNSLTVPAGATVSLFFIVNVGGGAVVGLRTVDGQVGGVDSVTGSVLNDSGAVTTSQWTVAGSATQITVQRSNGLPIAGAPYTVTITALDAAGRTVTTFASGITLSTRLNSSPALTATGQVNLLYPTWNRGLAVFGHSYNRSEGVYLKAFAGALVGNSLGITPVAGALNRYWVVQPASVVAGAPFSLTLTPIDLYGNTCAGAASVSFTPRLLNGALGSASPAVTSLNASGGSISTYVDAYNKAEVLDLVATAGGFSSLTWEAQTLTVLPAAVSTYSLQNPSIGVVGVYFPVTVTAVDAYGNTVSVAHAISMTVNGGVGSLSNNWLQLSNGVSVVAETYSQSGTIKLVATGPSVSSVLAQTTAIVFSAPTATPTFTFTPTSTTSPTPTATQTPTITETSTISPSPTFTSSVTPTYSNTSTVSPTWSSTSTISPSPTFTSSVTPTYSNTSTVSPTWSSTSTVTPTDSDTMTTTPTNSQTSTATSTDTATATATSTNTPTATPTATASPTCTASPTFTATSTDTASATVTPTSTATPPWTATPTPSASVTSTITPSCTVTLTPPFARSGTDKTVVAPSFLRRGDTMKTFFAERPASCKVEVFTMAGDRVAHLETGLDGQPSWNPSNNASGIYLLVVETNFVSGHYERFKTKVALVQ